MAKRSVPQYCRHKATGQAYVKICGRCRYLGIYGSAESHKRYAAVLAEWHSQEDIETRDLSIAQLTVLYFEHCNSYYVKHGKPTSEVQAVRDTLKRLNRLYRHELAQNFTPKMLKAVRESMVNEGLARTTINGSTGRIRRMFRWAVGDGNSLVPPVVLNGLEAVSDLKRGRTTARETSPVTPVPFEHVDAVKPYVSRPIWGAIQLQLTTGARPGEALIIRSCDLNTSGRVWEYRPETHKTEHHGKERIVFIGPAGQALLRDFLTTDLQAYLFQPRDAVSAMLRKRCRPGARVRSDLGDRYTLHSYSSAIRRACIKAGVPLWSANQLRHNFATRARREAGIEAARVTLGHPSAVTSEIYAEIDHAKARELVLRIG